MKRSGDWVLVAGAILALAVWFAVRSSDAAPSVALPRSETAIGPTVTPSTAQRADETRLAADFTLETLDGDFVSLSDYRGTVVLVNFWASWCGPCRIEIPELLQAYGDLSERGFQILAVNVGEEADDIREFVLDMGMTYPVLLDTDLAVARAYGLRGTPSSFLVDQEGVLRLAHVGIMTETMLRERVSGLLKGAD